MSAGNGHATGYSSEDLRAAVRAVLGDVLGESAQGGTLRALDDSSVRSVALRTDGDLDAFVRDIATRCEDPVERAALRDGRRRFRLAPAEAGESSDGQRPPAAAAVVRVERGAVTERTVGRAAAEQARLVLGPRAVLTPLARDKARTLGVEIERER